MWSASADTAVNAVAAVVAVVAATAATAAVIAEAAVLASPCPLRFSYSVLHLCCPGSNRTDAALVTGPVTAAAGAAAVITTADRTVASGEGGLEYIATAAGLQQFKQTALAYVLLNAAGSPCGEEEVAVAAEALLCQKLQLQVCVCVRGLSCLPVYLHLFPALYM